MAILWFPPERNLLLHLKNQRLHVWVVDTRNFGLYFAPMDEITRNNPVERYVECFARVQDAAAAAGVSTEALRKMRKAGHVTTRSRALHMSQMCNSKVSPAELLAVDKARRARQAA